MDRRICESCGRTLDKQCVLTDRWEDGDNPYAYVTCRWCQHQNILYDWGGDDD